MSESVLEIIELPNGEYALKRADGEGEPLVNIRLSDESKHYLDGAALDVVKVMIQAGIQAVAQMSGKEDIFKDVTNTAPQQRVLH